MVPMLLELPRWLLARGRELEAKNVLASIDGEASDAEFLKIRESVRQEMAVQASWSQILKVCNYSLPSRSAD